MQNDKRTIRKYSLECKIDVILDLKNNYLGIVKLFESIGAQLIVVK